MITQTLFLSFSYMVCMGRLDLSLNLTPSFLFFFILVTQHILCIHLISISSPCQTSPDTPQLFPSTPSSHPNLHFLQFSCFSLHFLNYPDFHILYRTIFWQKKLFIAMVPEWHKTLRRVDSMRSINNSLQHVAQTSGWSQFKFKVRSCQNEIETES